MPTRVWGCSTTAMWTYRLGADRAKQLMFIGDTLEQTQMMATVFDGITRHNPESMWFRRYAQAEGFKAAVQWRNSGEPIPERDTGRNASRDMSSRPPQD